MDKKTAAQKSGSQTRKHHSTIPSQRERILAVLQSGQSLTAYEMHQMDLRYLSEENKDKLKAYVLSLPQRQRDKVVFVTGVE